MRISWNITPSCAGVGQMFWAKGLTLVCLPWNSPSSTAPIAVEAVIAWGTRSSMKVWIQSPLSAR